MQVNHRYHADGYTPDRHNDVLDQVAEHDAMHASEYGIEHGKQGEHDPIEMSRVLRRNMEWDVGLHRMPGNKNFNELTETNEPIREETQTTNDRKDHGYDM